MAEASTGKGKGRKDKKDKKAKKVSFVQLCQKKRDADPNFRALLPTELELRLNLLFLRVTEMIRMGFPP